MHVQVDAVGVQLLHETAQSLNGEQHAAVVVGVGDVGFQHGGGKDVLQAVVVNLETVELQLPVGVLLPQPDQRFHRGLDLLRRPDVVRPLPTQRQIAFSRDIVRGLVHGIVHVEVAGVP